MARLLDLSQGLDGKQRLLIEVDSDYRQLYAELAGKDIDDPVIRERRRKRSLDANGYCWTLIDKIAAALNITPVEVYRESIRDIAGVSTWVCVKNEAVEQLKRNWSHNGIGWFAEEHPSKVKGCTNLQMFSGSSVYDTKQMSALIDVVIEAAKALNIQTMTPAEVARLEGLK